MKETKDYSKFKFLSTNRGIKLSNLKKIKESIKEWGVIPGRPVLVDKDFNIVDGQHRFVAIKELGLSVPYEVIEGDITQKTMALNAVQTPWKIEEFISSYAEQKIDCYRRLSKFIEKFRLGVSNSISLFIGHNYSSVILRKGKVFKIQDDAEDVAEFLLTFEALPFYKTDKFVKSIIILYKKSEAKQRNIVRSNLLKIQKSANIPEYLTQFENIINYKKRGANVIKL